MARQSSTLLKRAKDGDAAAIASLINRSLNPKGIQATATITSTQLNLTLRAATPFNQGSAVSWLKRAIANLDCPFIDTVQVSAQAEDTGDLFFWQENFFIHNSPSHYPTDPPNSEAKPPPERRQKPPETVDSVPPSQPKPPQPRPRQKELDMELFLEGLKLCFLNPFGLEEFNQKINRKAALKMGCILGGIYVIAVFLSYKQSVLNMYAQLASAGRINNFSIFITAVITFLSFIVASAAVRLLFKGEGNLDRDVLVAGIALIVPAAFIILSTFLGVGNIEIILMLAIISLTYTILMLHIGCNKISQIPLRFSPLAVAVLLILSFWFTKIMLTIAVMT
ncbi:hypothetical protein PN462_22945 [Spirulina sp. CS-785/01]|uniref:hypothetical protein n=1 Tax=Spirulina sp. CS-785/01 TaxID=3021716 RepID=UPI0023300EE0|nr:hypothetical protein [Spirulina sp. CS-785/01]MDB9315987.1 hypothetical protein [Spirulina sp. CS-785/01]